MNVAALEKLVKKKPFDPFEIVLSSGDRYIVTHPENCLLMKKAVVVALATSPKEKRPDDFEILSYPRIAAAEPVNGKNKTR